MIVIFITKQLKNELFFKSYTISNNIYAMITPSDGTWQTAPTLSAGATTSQEETYNNKC